VRPGRSGDCECRRQCNGPTRRIGDATTSGPRIATRRLPTSRVDPKQLAKRANEAEIFSLVLNSALIGLLNPIRSYVLPDARRPGRPRAPQLARTLRPASPNRRLQESCERLRRVDQRPRPTRPDTTSWGQWPCATCPSTPSSTRVWLMLVGVAHDLLVWTQRLLLTGELARCEAKRLRYRLLHVAARLVARRMSLILRSARRGEGRFVGARGDSPSMTARGLRSTGRQTAVTADAAPGGADIRLRRGGLGCPGASGPLLPLTAAASIDGLQTSVCVAAARLSRSLSAKDG
jgi:hypothetical protein